MEARDATLLADHLNQSLERLPGPAYYNVLRWIHRIMEPANYVEIGVNRGISLVQAVRGTPCVGVDPAPDIHPDVREQLAAADIYDVTSDEFFARHDLRDLLGGPVALAFIDGLHLFEQVLRDFVNLERYSSPSTVILLHDSIPLDEVTASRDRTTDFYCGDVWKAVLALRRRRPELEMITVRTAPTGLSLVRGLDSRNRQLEGELPEIVTSYTDLDFEYYLTHRDEMPDEIANEREAVGDWLRSGPAS
jgi:predicted O-methyltransferase YrrM